MSIAVSSSNLALPIRIFFWIFFSNSLSFQKLNISALYSELPIFIILDSRGHSWDSSRSVEKLFTEIQGRRVGIENLHKCLSFYCIMQVKKSKISLRDSWINSIVHLLTWFKSYPLCRQAQRCNPICISQAGYIQVSKSSIDFQDLKSHSQKICWISSMVLWTSFLNTVKNAVFKCIPLSVENVVFIFLLL